MRTLVIDDQYNVLKELRELLGNTLAPDGKHHSVVTAREHKSGIKLLAKERFDLVITDMHMGPDEDEGLAVIRELIWKSPIAIVLTGVPSFPNCVQAIRMGAWDYLEKVPADQSDPYENLIKSIQGACDYRRTHPESGKAKGDIEWTHENIQMLIRKYSGKAIAVLDQQVVEVGDNAQQVLKRVLAGFPFARPQIVSIPGGSTEEA